MQYMGGKSRIARYIAEFMNELAALVGAVNDEEDSK